MGSVRSGAHRLSGLSPGADLLGEHLVARDIVLGERVELGLTGVPAATANRKKAP
jgi:hypothetical protein